MRRLSKLYRNSLQKRIRATPKALILDLGELRISDKGMITHDGAPMNHGTNITSSILHTLGRIAMEVAEFQRQAAKRTQ